MLNEAADMETSGAMPDDLAARLRAAARAAVAEIEDGMLIGLGTGMTAAFAIAALGERTAAGLKVNAVATSLSACRVAAAAGVPVRPFDTLAELDLAIDGADEIDQELRAIKGKGGAMLREKVLAAAAARMIVVIDADKEVVRLGRAPLPVEVLPFAARFVSARIERLGALVDQRMAGDAPFRTEQDNFVLDCRFGAIDDPQGLAAALSAIPGMLGHGLFIDEIDMAYVGRPEGVLLLSRRT